MIYNRLLNQFPFDEQLLFLLADIDLHREYNGRAINLLTGLLVGNPNNGAAWCNLGAAFRKEHDYARAEHAWLRALALGETTEVCNNLATLYADSGDPHKALGWVSRSLGIKETTEALWHKALASLTLKQWDEGWKHYEIRQKLESWDSREAVKVPLWDGSPVEHLYIHGEQGVGDEIMFASAIPKVRKIAKRITLEVNAKVVGIMQQTWPDFDVVKETTPGKYDAKVPIGSLIWRLGMNTTPYLRPHHEKVAHYRRELEKLGKGPYLALAWFGGTKNTRASDRSFSLSQLKPIRDRYTCVSGQYEDGNPYIGQEREGNGLVKINDACIGGDLHDQAALFKAVDAVVTVQQTAVHVAGSVGAKCYAMIGEHPHWRYGLEGDTLPFYSSVSLYRRKGGWDEVVSRVAEALERDFAIAACL